MPELLEVEVYRRLADKAVGRTVEEVEAPDSWFLKGGITPGQVVDAVRGATLVATGRRGKLLTVDLGADRPVLGLRFGMTGRLALDGEAPIGQLEYASGRDEPVWDRFALRFTDGARLRLSDPRRLGGVELDPDLGALGPDAWSLTLRELRTALAGSTAPLKARLLDQHRLAGLGNLLVDETLWRARLDPARPAGSLSDAELRRLQRRIVSTVGDLFERGGSHRGDLQAERHRDGHCPRCGTPLDRRTVGGRTTYSCARCARAAAA
ncbi:DNA-formamidopyrimidine glycosylase family protein [Aquihabitans daechungensis]|uniref:DNA-formamidopyrimidine glycosylase family protein n=1 Tax=Aquihabitans daechungensis TaxID=1052257 RepID=UPI003BA159AF